MTGWWLASAAVIAVSAYKPVMVGDWLLENLLVVFLLIAIILSQRLLPLSKASYILIFLFLCVHEYGAHYKYADVPPGEWLKPILQTSRNHYDRIAHFSFGLLMAYPLRDLLVRSAALRGWWSYYIPVDVALAFGGSYEILEWIVASIVSPEAGEAFVGMQGDMWDAQKDIALAGVGAVIAMLVAALVGRRRET